jgi:monolysocardiolipin acyltransferase
MWVEQEFLWANKMTLFSGKVNEEKSEMRLKWGVGRMICEAKVAPVVIPIYHQGMDSILPNRTPYW